MTRLAASARIRLTTWGLVTIFLAALAVAAVSLDWDMRIYEERERSLTYVCEVPVLYEQRAFAIAKLIEATDNDVAASAVVSVKCFMVFLSVGFCFGCQVRANSPVIRPTGPLCHQ